MAKSLKARPASPLPVNTKWPADKVVRRALAKLLPDARNARTHSDAQVAEIAASITAWGWTSPVLVDDDGRIIAGHGRVLAAQRLGLADVPVMTASGWTDAQKRAYALADNKIALNAGWDEALLALEIGELRGLGIDLALTGFSLDEIQALGAVKAGGQGGWTPRKLLSRRQRPQAPSAICGGSESIG